MNPEINSIIEDMRKFRPKEPIATSDIHTYQSVQMARLLFLLAEESEKQSTKLSEQTEKLIQFTKAIKTLTLVLLFVGIVQIVLMVANFFRCF